VIQTQKGVCQDFAHVMIAMTRGLGIPARYVSGYLYQRSKDQDRSRQGASHAWMEALLPGLGWVGFDPTNNLLVGDRHIRTAIGRDYADVPPTRGVFKGDAEGELSVGVRVVQSDSLPPLEEEMNVTEDWSTYLPPDQDVQQQQQQQQQ